MNFSLHLPGFTNVAWLPLYSVGLACLLSCTPDLSVPSNAGIACQTKDDCPANYDCRVALGRCVPLSADTAVPDIAASTISRQLARVGDTVEVTVTATVFLESPPVLTLQGESPRSISLTQQQDKTFAYSMEVRTEDGNGAVPITTTLLSTNGVASPELTVATLTIDSSPPEVVGTLTAAPLRLGPDQTVVVSFTASEELGEVPGITAVWPESNSALPVPGTCQSSGSGSGLDYECSIVMSGVEAEMDLQASVEISLRDVAGNMQIVKRSGLFTLDVTPPTAMPEFTFVRLRPGPSNPLQDVSAVTFGSTVEIGMQFDEQLGAAPTALALPADLPFVIDSIQGSYALMSLLVTDTLNPQTTSQLVQITAVDLYGNASTFTLHQGASLNPTPVAWLLDTQAPTDAPVDAPGAFVHHRAPHGSLASPGAADFWVTYDSDLFDEEGWLFLTDRQDFSTAARLGQALIDGQTTGVQLAQVLGPDRQHIYLHRADFAGNVSAGRRVRDISWVASPKGKIVGDTFANPHVFKVHKILSETSASDGLELGASDGIGALDAEAFNTRGAATWRRVSVAANDLTPRLRNAAAFDPVRRSVLLLGPADQACAPPPNQLFVRQGSAFVQQDISAAPVATAGRVLLTTDISRQVVVGVADNGSVWEWNGGQWSDACATPACLASRPMGGSNTHLVYDALRQRAVLLRDTMDTYDWNGSLWVQTCTDTPCVDGQPSARTGAGATFDASEGEILLFGGSSGGDETWTFNGSRWLQRCTESPCTDSMPAARRFPTLVYNPKTSRSLLFSGNHVSYPVCPDGLDHPADTWVWENGQWSQLVLSQSPPGRTAGGVVYDPVQEQIVLVGGGLTLCSVGCPGPPPTDRGDIWTWNGAEWSELQAPSAPPHTRDLAMIYAPEFDAVIMYGGELGGLWQWSGSDWSQRFVSSEVRRGPTLAVHDGTTYMYGGWVLSVLGETNDLFALADSTWNVLASFGTPSRDAVMGSSGSSLVILGGVTDSPVGGNPNPLAPPTLETWLYDGAATACNCDPVPGGSLLRGTTLGSGELFVAGGYNSTHAHRFSSGAWVAEDPSPKGERWRHHLTYSSHRDAVLLYGGEDRIGYAGTTFRNPTMGNVWEWRDGLWTAAEIADPEGDGYPGPSEQGAWAYDPNHRHSVLFGGRAWWGPNSYTNTHTWVFDDAATRAPFHEFEVRFGTAGAESAAEILSIEADWYGSGLGYDTDGSIDGIKLLLWNGLTWTELQANQQHDGNYSWAQWRSDQDPTTSSLSPQQLASFTTGIGRLLRLAAQPLGPNGPAGDYAEIATDYVELRVNYRLAQ